MFIKTLMNFSCLQTVLRSRKYFFRIRLRLRIKIVIPAIYKNFFSNHDFFLYKFFKSLINRQDPEPEPELEPELEPEPQFVIPAPAPGGTLISAPRLLAPAPQHCLQISRFLKRHSADREYTIFNTLWSVIRANFMSGLDPCDKTMISLHVASFYCILHCFTQCSLSQSNQNGLLQGSGHDLVRPGLA